MRQVLRAAAALSIGLAVPLIAFGAATAPIPVRANAPDEVLPAGGMGYLAWTQGAPRLRKAANVWVMRENEAPVRVNPAGVKAFTGGMDNTRLVYQRVRRRQSDLRLFDVATRAHYALPADINTRRWEWRPTLSGGWLLFGRRTATSDRVLLANLTTGKRLTLAAIRRGRGRSVTPGQVSGAYAVWTKCTARRVCDVYRYDIDLGTTTQVPSPGTSREYAASVSSLGTAYFLRSGPACGASLQLVKSTLGGVSTVLYAFPAGVDAGQTYTGRARVQPGIPGPVLALNIYFDRSPCGRNRWDIYRLDHLERPPPSPPGIPPG